MKYPGQRFGGAGFTTYVHVREAHGWGAAEGAQYILVASQWMMTRPVGSTALLFQHGFWFYLRHACVNTSSCIYTELNLLAWSSSTVHCCFSMGFDMLA